MMSVIALENTTIFNNDYNYCHFSKLLNFGSCDRVSNLSLEYFVNNFVPSSPLMKTSTDCRMITDLFHENFMLARTSGKLLDNGE